MDLPVTASDAVVFRSPGVPTVVAARNVYIRADYTNTSGCGQARNIAPHAYAVMPGGAVVPLAYIAGAVYDGPGTTSSNQLSDATVEIVDGESAGKRATTISNGSFMIEFLQMGQPFTIRASKAGYSTDTQTSPGIVDDAGYPSGISFTFHLR